MLADIKRTIKENVNAFVEKPANFCQLDKPFKRSSGWASAPPYPALSVVISRAKANQGYKVTSIKFTGEKYVESLAGPMPVRLLFQRKK